MDVYLHVRVLLSMILGLGVGHLLRGVSRIVQHPTKIKVYWVHLVWVLFVFLYLIHFWWWEFYLQKIQEWTFPLYFFLAIYATLLFLLCSLFFPEEMSEYDGYRDYYYSRKHWIFTLMVILFTADILGTFIKGSDYFARLGVFYEIRMGSYILFCVLSIWVKNPRFHAVFAIFALITEILNILKRYLTIH